MSLLKGQNCIRNHQPELIAPWISWINQQLHDDTNGRYFAFSLNSAYQMNWLTQRLEARCPRSVFFYVLPAISFAGNYHFHGLGRLAAEHLDNKALWVKVPINEHSKEITIKVPQILHDVLWRRSANQKKSWNIFGDLHLRHTGRYLDTFTYGPGVAHSVLSYLGKTSDGEIREFSQGDFVPFDHRSLIKVRTGREPKPRTSQTCAA